MHGHHFAAAVEVKACVMQVREPTGPIKMDDLFILQKYEKYFFMELNVTGRAELAGVIDGTSSCGPDALLIDDFRRCCSLCVRNATSVTCLLYTSPSPRD